MANLCVQKSRKVDVNKIVEGKWFFLIYSIDNGSTASIRTIGL